VKKSKRKLEKFEEVERSIITELLNLTYITDWHLRHVCLNAKCCRPQILLGSAMHLVEKSHVGINGTADSSHTGMYNLQSKVYHAGEIIFACLYFPKGCYLKMCTVAS